VRHVRPRPRLTVYGSWLVVCRLGREGWGLERDGLLLAAEMDGRRRTGPRGPTAAPAGCQPGWRRGSAGCARSAHWGRIG
jgi:hypothetical protein